MDEAKNTLIDLVTRYPHEKCGETALVFLDKAGAAYQQFTFKELEDACFKAAQNLIAASPAKETVLIALDDQAQFVTAFFGCILAGKIPAPMPSLKARKNKQGWGRALQIIRSGKAAALLVSQQDQEEIATLLRSEDQDHVKLYAAESLTKEPVATNTLPEINPDAVAYIQYTSGSTSQPKGILLTHRQVLNNMERMYTVFNRGKTVKVAGWIPFYHDMGLVGHLFTALYESGFGVFLPPAAFLANPAIWLETIDKYKANSAAAPTFAFEHCARKIKTLRADCDLSSWENAYVGSETVSLPVLNSFYEKFKAHGFDRNTFRPVYGLAEVTLLAAGGSKGLDALDELLVEKETGLPEKRALIPYPIDLSAPISIHDPESGIELANGEEGEIWVTSDSNFSGYLEDAQDSPASSIVKTGDLGFIDKNVLYLTGRKKEVVIVRGVNYNAEDLEFCIRHHQPDLQLGDATACVSAPDTEKEQFYVFQEVNRHLESGQLQAIAQQIQANLAEYTGIQADSVVLLPQGLLPRTSNYKIARSQCAALFRAGKLKTLFVAEAKPSASAPKEEDAVVIVGMACRFPGGANTLEKYWELLANGTDAITEVPADRWDNALFYNEKPAVPGKLNTKWAGFIDEVDHFDPALFGISGYEANEIDPQQRLVLETSWRLLEHTGWKKDHLKGSNTGVFVGISTNDYLYMKIKLIPGMDSFNAYSGLGNAHSIAANRVSYYYDLKGPSMAVDTACSSSLTAFHLGAQAIANGDCDQAIVGGVNAILSPGSTITLSQFGMMAPDGRCKAFDSSANGYVRSEGCGLVMLKRKSLALQDGDQILATVVSSSAAQDGFSQGITYPNGEAQYQLIQSTLDKANLSGSEISYVEAHGTGTVSGDPVEMEQIRKLYGLRGDHDCYVGSVKANIGHLEASAGIASVIKSVLMLQHQSIPPQIHLNELNPKINLAHSRLKIAPSVQEWKSSGSLRKAAISSFGFGGSLAHVILEEEPMIAAQEMELSTDYLVRPFVLSANTAENLKHQAQKWSGWLEENTEISFADLCSTQALGRSDLQQRTYFLADSKPRLKEKLDAFLDQKSYRSPFEKEKICFLFTGQGEQYIYMGREMYHRFPVFRENFDRCVNSISYADPDFSLKRIAFEQTDLSERTDRHLQPIIFAVQYALGQLYAACGVNPDILLGHSLGEYAAACLAGCFTPETGMQILQKRGELMEKLSPFGGMATIFTSASEVEKAIAGKQLEIAVYTSQRKTVISGNYQDMIEVCQFFEAQGIEHYVLKTSQAFHSRFVEPIMDEFTEFLKGFTFHAPFKKWLSSATGDWITKAIPAEHWVQHLRNAVLFAQAAEKLPVGQETIHFVEIGPGASTLAAINDHLQLKNALLLRSMLQKKGSRTEEYYFLDSLGKLYEAGYAIHWEPVLGKNSFPSQIPGYAFSNQSYWVNGIDASKLSAFATNYYSNNTDLSTPAELPALHEPAKPSIHYELAWNSTGKLPAFDLSEALSKEVNWIIIGEAAPLTESILTLLKAQLKSVFWLGPKKGTRYKPDVMLSENADKEELFKKIDKIINFQAKQEIDEYQVLFICPSIGFPKLSADIEALNTGVRNTVGSFSSLLQGLNKNVGIFPIWLVTENAQSASAAEVEHMNLHLAPVWGFAKTAYLEHPESRGGLIDVSIADPVEQRAESILRKIVKPKSERSVLLRNGEQFIEQIVPAQPFQAKESLTLRPDGAYLITGGSGGLGIESAKWLIEKGAKHLILLGRKQLPPVQEWDQLLPEHAQFDLVQKLLPIRNSVEKLEVISMDIRDTEALTLLFKRLDDAQIPVRGVLHAAGINWYSKIIDMDKEELIETLKIKVASSWALHQLTKDRDLDCFIMYSSVSALWGSVKLSHYSAANYFMDMLSLYRSQLGLPSLTIDWGPWGEVGMSAGESEKEVLGILGFHLMEPKTSLEAMEKELLAKRPLALIGEIDWATFRPFIDFSLQPSLFEHVAVNPTKGLTKTSEGLADILSSPPAEARTKIEEVVRMELSRVILLDSMERIEEDQRFNFLGMDSLMAISFVVEIEQFFETKLPSTLPYNYPHIRAVTDYLFETIYLGNAVQEETGKPAEAPQAPAEAIQPAVVEKGNLFIDLKTGNGKDAKLFVFPSAGSGVSLFNKLVADLDPEIAVIGMQFPGREERALEAPYKSMPALIEYLLNEFETPESDYYFFGHSLGGLIAYELYAALKSAGKRLPQKLILSGTGAPLEKSVGELHLLNDEQFINEIVNKYENSQNIEQRTKAMQSVKEMIRADIEVLETHVPKHGEVIVPLVLIAGLKDEICKPARVKEWTALAQNDFAIHYCDANHDLVNESRDKLAEVINREIAPTGNMPAVRAEEQVLSEEIE